MSFSQFGLQYRANIMLKSTVDYSISQPTTIAHSTRQLRPSFINVRTDMRLLQASLNSSEDTLSFGIPLCIIWQKISSLDITTAPIEMARLRHFCTYGTIWNMKSFQKVVQASQWMKTQRSAHVLCNGVQTTSPENIEDIIFWKSLNFVNTCETRMN